MGSSVRAAAIRFAIFTLVSILGMFGLFIVFAQLRFQPENTYHALFTSVSGLRAGNFVRIAGVEVGKVENIEIKSDSTAFVSFSADNSVALSQGTRAVIRYDDLVGGRFLSLEEAVGNIEPLRPGQTIPLDRTQPALDLDALIGGFRPLFRALDPKQVNDLSAQLIDALEGQGGNIDSLLAQTAALTTTLANRDELIGQVITNLTTVIGTVDARRGQVSASIDSLSQLISSLTERKTDIAESINRGNAAASTIADLLDQSRPPLQKVVREADRSAGIAVADHEYLDDLLATLPDAYQALARQGLYGDFFSFYLCEILFKVNGKGGQPVYVKVTGQPSGRCAPK
ncbi:MCE family protein [Mycobacterium deserti]|uniref:MCE family protein n=1 Tax=Mycobacterium deserti TaxID=2978347 RepID=A0ABT2MEQ1_9MYCO|nr:MCE family protein [Mycobacterium deserti]MCT7660738.1 MCE family protein [Mycobacterium deserti]